MYLIKINLKLIVSAKFNKLQTILNQFQMKKECECMNLLIGLIPVLKCSWKCLIAILRDTSTRLSKVKITQVKLMISTRRWSWQEIEFLYKINFWRILKVCKNKLVNSSPLNTLRQKPLWSNQSAWYNNHSLVPLKRLILHQLHQRILRKIVEFLKNRVSC